MGVIAFSLVVILSPPKIAMEISRYRVGVLRINIGVRKADCPLPEVSGRALARGESSNETHPMKKGRQSADLGCLWYPPYCPLGKLPLSRDSASLFSALLILALLTARLRSSMLWS